MRSNNSLALLGLFFCSAVTCFGQFGQSTAAGTFEPRNYGGKMQLIGVWDASIDSTITESSGLVSSFRDRYAGIDLTATTTKRPSRTNSFNGYPVLTFDGVNDYLKGSLATPVIQPQAMLCLFKSIAWPVNKSVFCVDNLIDIHGAVASPGMKLGGTHSVYSTNFSIGEWHTLKGHWANPAGYNSGNLQADFNSFEPSAYTESTIVTNISLGGTTIGNGFANVEISDFIMFNQERNWWDSAYMQWGMHKKAGTWQNAKSIVCDGDSLTSGTCGGAGVGAGNDYPTQLLTLLGGPTKYFRLNLGACGYTWVDMLARPDGIDQFWPMVPQSRFCIPWGGHNDLAVDKVTFSTLTNRATTYLLNRANIGWRTVPMTVLPGSDITGTNEITRTNYNAWLQTNYAALGCAGVINLHLDPLIGFPNAQTNATYYNGGIHLTVTGYAVVATNAFNVISGL